ncbi:MAG: lamin tail domain-containing protein [Bellilinea sp.]
MNFWKRIFPYLILNILVSAATTLIVLMVWDRVQYPVLSGAAGGIPEAVVTSNPGAVDQQVTLPPLDTPVIRIETVIGAGDLPSESIQLQRIGEGDLQLEGWRLEGNGKEYVFPKLTLNKNGSIRLYTRAGQSTVIELFWGLDKAAWKTGDTIILFDSAGNQRATYSIP